MMMILFARHGYLLLVLSSLRAFRCFRRQLRSRVCGNVGHLTAVLGALAAVGAALTALLADEATAQDCETGHEAAAVFLLLWLLLRGSLLVAHLNTSLSAFGSVVFLACETIDGLMPDLMMYFTAFALEFLAEG